MVMITRIWPAVGKIDFFIPLVLDEAVTLVSALEPGVETEITERISEILLALSSSGPMLRGKLLARLRQVNQILSMDRFLFLTFFFCFFFFLQN